MIRFFKKHGHKLSDYDALQLIHDEIEDAKCGCEEGVNYSDELKDAFVMLRDVMKIRGITIPTDDELPTV